MKAMHWLWSRIGPTVSMLPKSHSLESIRLCLSWRRVLYLQTLHHSSKPPSRTLPKTSNVQLPNSETESRTFDPNVSIERFISLYESKPPSVRQSIESILQLYEYQKYAQNPEVQLPFTLTQEDMRYLLDVTENCQNQDLDTKQHEFERAFIRLFRREDMARQKAVRKAAVQARAECNADKDRTGIFDQNGHLYYGLWHNTMFTRIPVDTMTRYMQRQLRTASLFGRKLIIDLSFGSYMNEREAKLVAIQSSVLYKENRTNRDFPRSVPFDIHFTSCGHSPITMQSLERRLERYAFNYGCFHQESYLDLPDLFPRDRLVYLTPNSRKPLTSFSDDDIFIVGGLNDRVLELPNTLHKATKEGIRMARLPLDENSVWRIGNKILTADVVVRLLRAVDACEGDWRKAIYYSLTSNVKSAQEVKLEDQLRMRKIEARHLRIHSQNKNSQYTNPGSGFIYVK